MAAAPGRHARQARAIEPHPIELTLDRRLLERHEVHPAFALIDACHGLSHPEHRFVRGSHRPVAACHLVDQGAVECVAVQVHVAVALGGPEELTAGRQEPQVVGHIDPRRIALGQNAPRTPGAGVRKVQRELLLIARERLDADLTAVWQPHHSQHVFERRVVDGNPSSVSAVHADDAHADARIRRPRARIPLAEDARLIGPEVHELAHRNGRFIGLEVCDGPAVRRPPPAGVFAAEDLLPVEPRQRSIERGLGSIAREPGLCTRGEVDRVEIVVADERHVRSVRRHIDVLLLGRR